MIFPISESVIKKEKKKLRIQNLGQTSIRDMVALVNNIENVTGEKFIRMEMGVPGLPSPSVGVESEIKALKRGVTSIYPDLDGLPELKSEIARFARLFLDINVKAKYCVPTVGAMQGSFTAALVASNTYKNREKATLFIDPGFNIHKLQYRILEKKYDSFDIFHYRGKKLKGKLESFLKTGEYCSILYSNPNNPTWQCLTEYELKIIGELATKYDLIVLEDLAYFGMDFRKDYSTPGQPPYQPTVAHYTENYVLLISSSKSMSYAGQRIGMMLISDSLCTREYEDLEDQFGYKCFGDSVIRSALYALSSGVSHTAQWGLYAILKAMNDGVYNYRNDVKVYSQRSNKMKKAFLNNGFHIVYDKDGDIDIADGFYFTAAYKDLLANDLLKLFLQYGLCAISLETTGSEQHGALRICVSRVRDNQLDELEKRLKMLHVAN